ncbi:hypothetical protein E3220_02820 [Piscirickettsia salmonis EM-90]|nr:hypothetical protein E3220_02820 [Piscirickettsia salmonis EM-90]
MSINQHKAWLYHRSLRQPLFILLSLLCENLATLPSEKNYFNQDLRIDNKIQLCAYKKLVFSVCFFHNFHEVLS